MSCFIILVYDCCVVRGSKTPVFSMSYNHAENCVLLCIVSEVILGRFFTAMQ